MIVLIKMQFFSHDGRHYKRKNSWDTNYECFGWWLPDLIGDGEKPPRRDRMVEKHETSENNDLQVLWESNEEQEESELDTESSCSYRPLSPHALAGIINPCTSEGHNLEAVIFGKPFASSMSPRFKSQATSSDMPSGFSEASSAYETACSSSSHLADLALTVEHEEEDTTTLHETREEFLKTATKLGSRLQALEAEAHGMHNELDTIRREFQLQEKMATNLCAEAKRLNGDIQDAQYLDDLIYMLQGQLDQISLRKWPFALANALPAVECNLVV